MFLFNRQQSERTGFDTNSVTDSKQYNRTTFILCCLIVLVLFIHFVKTYSYEPIEVSPSLSLWEIPFPPVMGVNNKGEYLPKTPMTPLCLHYEIVNGKELCIEQFVPFGEQIDLNTAGEHTLTMIRGIGRVTARSIIRYREKNGGFKHISELLKIDGIGQNTYLRLAPLFHISQRTESDD